jgi:uncharacterized protein (DUF2461 family)
VQEQKPASSQTSDRDWRDLAERAAREMDPLQLTELVNQLCDKLDEARPRYRAGCIKSSLQRDADFSRENAQRDFPTIHHHL